MLIVYVESGLAVIKHMQLFTIAVFYYKYLHICLYLLLGTVYGSTFGIC